MFRENLDRRGFLALSAGGALAALSGCTEKPVTPKAASVVRLRQEWFPYSGFAGEVLAAARFAQKAGVRLEILAGGETVDPIKTVLAGQDDMGVVSADLLIKAVAGGAPLVAVGAVCDTSPTCFITKAASGIRDVKGFVGKRVGVLRGTNTERIYQLLMRRNNVDRALVKEVDAPFDLNTFILGQYDVRPGFIYDEPVTLARSNVPINIIKPADYGVRFMGTVYFTQRDVIEKRRADVVAALSALVQGWRDVATAAGQTAAITELKRIFPEIDVSREAESLRLGAPLFLGPAGSNRPLTATPANIEGTMRGLVELGDLTAELPTARFWTDELLTEAYRAIQG